MRYCRNLFITSLAVFCSFDTLPLYAALKPTGFPQTFQDVPFTQRMEIKKAGYEPYKDLKAYVVPDFKDTDEKFKNQLCERDRVECCRRWPDYKGKTFSCQPQIRYETYGGKADKCPTFYYTNQGATISCVPTRDHSDFKGWCTDAAHKHCAMVQTIAIGEKDDKVYYADWDCQSPWIEKNNKCVCPDPNMDDKCECSGTGMWENPSNNMCECIANSDTDRLSDAVIQNKNCVCVDPLLDINSNCKARLTACPDTPHQNPADCSCYAAPNAKPDGAGMCKCVDKSDVEDPYQQIVGTGSAQQCQCKDTTLMEIDSTTGKCKCKDGRYDVANNCQPSGDKYVIMQCRTYKGWSASLGGAINYVTGQLECRDGNHDDISQCFKQCAGKGNRTYPNHYLNDTIESAYPGQGLSAFCSGKNASGDHELFLKDDADHSKKKVYTEDEAMDIYRALSGKGMVSQCGVSASLTSNYAWYVIFFKYDETTETIQVDKWIKLNESNA